MDDDLKTRYCAALVHLALQLSRSRLGKEAPSDAVEMLAQEELRHAFDLAGMPMAPEAVQ